MRKFMSLALAVAFVLGISIFLAIGNDGTYLKWDVGQDGTFDTSVTVPVGNAVTVDLYATDIPASSKGASSFEIGEEFNWYKGMNHDPSWLQCNSVTIDNTDWPQFTYIDWTSDPRNINAGGGAPLGKSYYGDKKLMTIEFQCLDPGSEKFDFTDTSPDVERFRLGESGGGNFDVDRQTYALTITCSDGGVSPAYADSHNYTQSGQPPRYCPPGPPRAPIGVHPEYALGSPDEKGTGWGPKTGELILGFPSPLKNVEGDDLTIWHVGDGTPKIWVSTQLENPDYWHEIGSLPASQEWRTDSFEFGNLDIIHYVKVEEWQSGQHTCHFIDAMGDQGATPPQVYIKINGQDGPVILHQSDTLSLAIAVDNKGITDDADWWLAVNIPSFGLYFFTPEGWTDAWLPVLQYPLFYIPLTDLFEFPVSVLPSGPYTFYFVVDTNMDGNLSVDNLYFDYIEVNIEP
jgi:hypothetical protein